MDIFAIVNPLSGVGADPSAAAARVVFLTDRLSRSGVSSVVRVTERRGHATELAASAIAGGARTVLAWGGDGTINEIATVVAGSNAALAIIPAGSGNGFANELGVPADPAAAIEIAVRGRDRVIDAGELNGRLFFNIAGIGVDAVIAEQFNSLPLGRRGLGPYVRIGILEAFRYRAATYRVTLDGDLVECCALVVAFANGREYGNRIRLAPQARLDDGKLEALVVEDRPAVSRLWAARHLALGTAHKAGRMVIRSVTAARVETNGEILYHLDGEIGRAQSAVDVRIRPGVLRVKVRSA